MRSRDEEEKALVLSMKLRQLLGLLHSTLIGISISISRSALKLDLLHLGCTYRKQMLRIEGIWGFFWMQCVGCNVVTPTAGTVQPALTQITAFQAAPSVARYKNTIQSNRCVYTVHIIQYEFVTILGVFLGNNIFAANLIHLFRRQI